MINVKNFLSKRIDNTIFAFKKLDNPEILINFNKLIISSVRSIKNGGKIILFGNGGSAADAQHLAAEMVVRFKKKNPRPLPAISLATDTSILTAIGNDYNFDKIFSRQIEALGNQKDTAIAITTSGNSKNIINAIKACQKKKIVSFCFTANNGGKIKNYANYPIIFPNNETSITQVLQIFLGQIFCEIIENKLN